MTYAGHTPGPWKWDSDPCNTEPAFRYEHAPWLVGDGDNCQAVIRGDLVMDNSADARLIAAAPATAAERDRLKAALEEITDYIGQRKRGIPLARILNRIETVIAALARVRGEGTEQKA